MKKLKLAVFLALAGVGLSQSAHALTFTEGDLFIGFYDTNAANSTVYTLDIGQASLYTLQNGASFNVLTSANGTNLTSINSADTTGWFASGGTSWGIVGATVAGDTNGTLYASSATNPQTFVFGTTIQQNGFKTSNIDAMEADFQNNGTSFNGSNGTTQSISDSNSFYAKGFGASTPFGFAKGFSATIGSGSGTVLDFFQALPKAAGNGNLGAGVLEGTFTVASNGTVTYQSVPEPSTLATLAGGISLLGLVRRRRVVAA